MVNEEIVKSVTQLFNDSVTFFLSFVVFGELFIKRDYFQFHSEINYDTLLLLFVIPERSSR